MSYPIYKKDKLLSSQLYYFVFNTDNRNIFIAKMVNLKQLNHKEVSYLKTSIY